MSFLVRNQQVWERKMLLSRSPARGADFRWSRRASVGTGAAQSRSMVRASASRPESKENDGGSNGAGAAIATDDKNIVPKGAGGSRGGASQKIYVDGRTLRAVKQEIEELPLPATLSGVCIALKSSEAVLDAHADADHSRLSDDDRTKGLEILGDFGGMTLSPTQKRNERRDAFGGACLSLVARGSSHMLNSWEEVEKELSEVFLFTAVDFDVTDGALTSDVTDTELASDGEGGRGGSTPQVPRGRSQTTPKRMTPKKTTPMKRTPQRSHRRTHKKARAANMLKVGQKAVQKAVKAVKKTPEFLTFESFQQQIRKRMGETTFQRVLKQGDAIVARKPSKSIDAAAARLDAQIQEKESRRREDLRVAEALAAKERADKEREAREAASKLMRPLTPDEQRIVDGAIRGIGPPAEILVKQDADSVQRGSMQTLRPGQWLNDEVINYFLKNCLAKRDEILCQKQPGRRRSHFFNSFFVQTLFDEKNNDPSKRGVYNYKNVRRWSKKVPGKDIFNLKYIVCPINLDNLHWTSAVIFVEEKKIQYYDSMGGTIHAKLEGLLRYLQDEHKAKKGSELDVSEWELVGCASDTPQQRNGFDCGVFTCMFADFISKDCPLVFSQEHVNQCRERIALSIMMNCAVEN